MEPEGIGTVITQINNDNGTTSNITFEKALYVPSYPVNIIIIACLEDFFKNNHDTFIKTTRYSSEFTWDFGKHAKTIQHAQSRIPEKRSLQLVVNGPPSQLSLVYSQGQKIHSTMQI